MGDFVIRLAAIASAAVVVVRVGLVPLARLVGRLLEEIGDVKTAIDDLPKIDAGLAELTTVKKAIDTGLDGMRKIVAGGDEQRQAFETDLTDWRDGHDEKHRQLDLVLASIEKRRPGR